MFAQHTHKHKEKRQKKLAEFHTAWFLVLLLGLFIFYDWPGLRQSFPGQFLFLIYLTFTIYYGIQTICLQISTSRLIKVKKKNETLP